MENIFIDKNNMPRHIAIIMDGNGRWAKKRGLSRSFGHKAGAEVVDIIVEECSNLGIESLTLFAFSTENWHRPVDEVSVLMKLIKIYIDNKLNRLYKNNARLRVFGDIEGLPKVVQESVNYAVEKTSACTGLNLNIALNYGAQAELVRAVKMIANDVCKNKLELEDIDEKILKNYLYSCGQPDVDLLIRPSGELRLSNFMLFQLAYAELWFSDVLWPDFTIQTLHEAILSYQKRDRRYGGIK